MRKLNARHHLPFRLFGIAIIVAVGVALLWLSRTILTRDIAVRTAHITQGQLSVTFRGNDKSPEFLSGIASLFNTHDAPGQDAIDPDTRGESAGLNFEHIISGNASANNKFSPRHGTYTLYECAGGKSVKLVRLPEDSPWSVGSTLLYTVTEPHYVDFEFRCKPTEPKLFDPHGYAIFFFANYMNDVEDVSIHFLGQSSESGPEEWIAADAPPGHPDWLMGGNYRSVNAPELACEENVEFRLNTWTYDWPRIWPYPLLRPLRMRESGVKWWLLFWSEAVGRTEEQQRAANVAGGW